MSLYDFAYFQVSVKAILRKGDEILLLIAPGGYYDFPGGRIDETEKDLDLHEVLKRELREELGSKLEFHISDIAFVSKRHYVKDGNDYRLIAVYFEADYLSGEVNISEEHDRHKWINPIDILKEPSKFMSADEYAQYKKYINKKSIQLKIK